MSVWQSLLIPNPTIRELTTCAGVRMSVNFLTNLPEDTALQMQMKVPG